MEWHINDLSIAGQFSTPVDFRKKIEPLLQLRYSEPQLRNRLFCSRQLYLRETTKDLNMHQAVYAQNDPDFTRLFLGWITKSGPFFDDERHSNPNDYFEFESENVTDQGLGEASRRVIDNIVAFTYSLTGSPYGFEDELIKVQHGRSNNPVEHIDVSNHWQITQIEEALKNIIQLNGWPDVYDELTRRYTNINFSSDVTTYMTSIPFSNRRVERIFVLANILNMLASESDQNNQLTKKGQEILANYFAGSCGNKIPLFSPETVTNKRSFKNAMTFEDPADARKHLFCHWHGKIKSLQIRIHFEWPRPVGQKEIKIVYIGPKITKN